MNSIIENKWFAHEVQNAEAQINFISFPYAGGSPSMFAPWKTELPAAINFFPVLYPGRELRKNDPMPENIDRFVETFLDQNMELFERDFILFGHCTGTLIAYQVLLEVRRRIGKEPLHFIASGSESPRYLMTRERELADGILADEELARQMVKHELVDQNTADSPIFQKYYLPIYRLDLQMLSTYQYLAQDQLSCPLHVLYGDDDCTIREEGIRDWASFTANSVNFKTFTGKHFYFAADKEPILEYINAIITESGAVSNTFPYHYQQPKKGVYYEI